MTNQGVVVLSDQGDGQCTCCAEGIDDVLLGVIGQLHGGKGGLHELADTRVSAELSGRMVAMAAPSLAEGGVGCRMPQGTKCRAGDWLFRGRARPVYGRR